MIIKGKKNMESDIRLQNGNKRFKFRVGGIVENKGKYLVVQMNKNNFYCFPGGHVELFEDTKTALIRELNEELYFDTEVNELVAINENFYSLRGDDFHEMCFYYFAKPKNLDISMEDKVVEEQDKFGTVTHRYKWIDKNCLSKYDIRPKQIVEYIVNNKTLKHFITKE